MKNKLHYTIEARRDLDEIYDYIAIDLQNPNSAEKTINKILDTADKLERFVGIGAPVAAVSGKSNDYRMLSCGSYLIFYRSFKNGVYIDRVLYSRRDYMRVLFGDI